MAHTKKRRRAQRTSTPFLKSSFARRLRAEQLEDRRLLTAVTVGNATDLVNGDTTSIAALTASGGDGGDGISLREAIAAANNTTGADTITFDSSLAGATITLGGTQLFTNDALTIDASSLTNNLTIDANEQSRVLLNSGANSLTLRGLTLTNGQTNGNGAGLYSASGDVSLEDVTITSNVANNRGGGIATNSGNVTLVRSTISRNHSGGNNGVLPFAQGGGVHTNSGNVMLADSSVSRNFSGDNGGGINSNSGNVTLVGSTISDNGIQGLRGNGAGIATSFGDVSVTGSTISGNSNNLNRGGAIFSDRGNVTLESSTVTRNFAITTGGIAFNGSFNNAQLIIRNSIVAGNTNDNGVPDIEAPTNLGNDLTVEFSLIGNTTGSGITSTTGTGNLLNVAPLLGALAHNGGPTQTHALAVGSPALNSGDPSFDPNGPDGIQGTADDVLFDQRGAGFARAIGPIDIGAFEQQVEFASLVVNTTSDIVDNTDFVTSLREAITFANSQTGSDTITFDAGLFDVGQTISIGSQLPTISDDLTISGTGANLLTIDAGGGADGTIGNGDGFRHFSINDSGTGQISVELSGLTLSGGDTVGVGGAIFNTENLTLTETAIAGNAASSNGGGVFNGGGGQAGVNRSTLSGNQSGGVGGAIINNFGTLTVTNSTLSGNSANNGGAIFNNQGPATIANSTVVNNSSGGLATHSATLDVTNSIVALNSGADDLVATGSGTIVGSFNLIEDGSGGLADSITGDPMLGVLAANGGATQTHALLLGSPAIDGGNSTLTTDQRGMFRPVDVSIATNATGGNGSDIGAVELQPEQSSFVVSTSSDVVDDTDFETSLREAIAFANSQAGGNTITFDTSLAGQTIVLTGGQLNLTDSVRINGDTNGDLRADITISGNNTNRIFNITGLETDVSLGSLTLTDGNASNGGAIKAIDTKALRINNSTITGNSATKGGGIYGKTDLYLTNSLISGNTTTSDGGGIYLYARSEYGPGETQFIVATLVNTTVHGNQGGDDGGGIFAGSSSGAKLINSTVTGNRGGGFAQSGGDLELINSVVAQNTSGSSNTPNDVGNFSPSSRSSAINSFIGAAATGFDSITDSINGGGDPLLGPLADNGGSTQTRNIQLGSPLISAGANAQVPNGLALDANGNSRIQNGTVDIGATEFDSPPLLTSIARLNPLSERTNADSLVFRVSFDESVTGVTGSDDFVVSGDNDAGNLLAVTGVSAVSDSRYDVTIGGSSLESFNGTIGLDLRASNDIVDLGGSALVLMEPTTDETYIVDNLAPTFSLVTPAVASQNNSFNFAGTVVVSVTDPAGVDTVEIALQNPFRMFFDGTSFDSSVPVFFTATDLGDGNYSIPVDAAAFPATQNYFPRVRSSDLLGNSGESLSASVNFNFTTELVVDTLVDESDGDLSLGDRSLREAIELANISIAENTISFDASLAGGTILLGGTELEVTDSLTIDASALATGLTIDAQQNSRVLHFTASTGDLTLNDLTLQNGRTTGTTFTSSGGGIRFRSGGSLMLNRSTVTGSSTSAGNAHGGGIYSNTGAVRLVDSTVSNNSTTGGNAQGGGIYAATGAVTLTGSTISGNSTGASDARGGGIAATSGAVEITNSTISGNQAAGNFGGGLYANAGNVVIEGSTITSNSSAVNGGGVVVLSGATTFNNTIIAGNTAPGPSPDFAGTGTNFSGSFNLLGTGDGLTSGSNNQTGITNPGLVPLADNGGPTQTHALLDDSPAIDAGNSTLSTDQRGLTRPVDNLNVINTGNGSDIGAVERQTGIPSLIVTTNLDIVDALDGVNSLREAIAFANNTTGANTITFDAGSFTGGAASLIQLTSGELEITDTLTIDATSLTANVTIDAQQNSRLLNFSATSGDLTLNKLALQNGQTSREGGGIFFGSSGLLTLENSVVTGSRTTSLRAAGGGIYAQGSVTLVGSTIADNRTDDDNSRGGGIYSPGGTITLHNSSVRGNAVERSGGAGIATDSGSVLVVNSTISGNSTAGSDPLGVGGGILTNSGSVSLMGSTISGNRSSYSSGGGIFTDTGSVSINNSTITNNYAYLSGGGIATTAATTISNSIVAGNKVQGIANDIVGNSTNFIGDFNLIGVGEVVTGTGNQAGITNPGLGPLADNGGPTMTHALLVGSPALDAGDPTAVAGQNGVPEFDQRGTGFERVQGGRIDIGAFEAEPAPSADFDSDGDIDGSDFLAWQRGFGSTNATPANGDANNDNDVDADDLMIWQSQFGQSTTAPVVAGLQSEASSGQPAAGVELVSDSALVAALVDAAFANEQRDESIGVRNFDAYSETRALDIDPAFASTPAPSQPTYSGDLQEIASPPEGDSQAAQQTLEPWLTDELLEQVFA